MLRHAPEDPEEAGFNEDYEYCDGCNLPTCDCDCPPETEENEPQP